MGTKAQVFETLLVSQRASGTTLAGGKVYFYTPGTESFKTIYQDRNKTIPAANPFTLSADGTAMLYGDGLYDVKLTDASLVQKAYWEDVYLVADISEFSSLADFNNDLVSAVSTIGATKTTLLIPADTTVTDNINLPDTIQLLPINGAVITIESGKTLTFNQQPDFPLVQVFAGSGNVAGLKKSYPEWFGAPYGTASNADDAGPAIRKAAATLTAGGTLYISGKHVFQSAETDGGFNLREGLRVEFVIRGVSEFFIGNNYPAKRFWYSLGATTKRWELINPTVTNLGDATFGIGTSLCTDALYGENVANSNIKNPTFRYFFNGTGIKLNSPNAVTGFYNQIINPTIVAKYGVHFTGNPAVNQANANQVSGGEIVGVAASGSVNAVIIDGGVGSTEISGTDIAGSFTDAAVIFDNAKNNKVLARMELSQILGANLYFDERNGATNNVFDNIKLVRPLRSSYLASGSSWPGMAETVQNIVLTGAQGTYTVPNFNATTVNIEVRSLTADLRITLDNARNQTQGQKVNIFRSGITDDSAFQVVVQPNPNTLIDSKFNSNIVAMSIGWKNKATFTCVTVSSTVAKWLVEKPNDTATASPTKGIYFRGDIVENRTPSASGVPGWRCVNKTEGTILANASAGATQIGMVTTTILAGDIVALFHADGTQGYYAIQTIDSGVLATLTSPLTANVATGVQNLMNTLFTYRFKTESALGA